MDVKTLGKITKWMETTDLEEITWKAGGDKITLKLNNHPQAAGFMSQSTLVPVTAPAIGVFRFARPGKTAGVKEGQAVKKGQELGVIEVAKEFRPVPCPENGSVKIVSVEDGKTVEYGQPLFFIEPR